VQRFVHTPVIATLLRITDTLGPGYLGCSMRIARLPCAVIRAGQVPVLCHGPKGGPRGACRRDLPRRSAADPRG
jgi:hypothetical protein